MDYRQFGRTDLKVGAIGFGCWEISGTYGRGRRRPVHRAVHRALDDGINCFDTAEAYGMGVSEQALAHALGSRRKDVCLVTKVGVGYPEAPNRRDSSRARIMASLEQSLKAISTPIMSMSISSIGQIRTRRSKKRCARLTTSLPKARPAISAYRISASINSKTCMKLRRIDVVQYGWNMFDRRMQREIFPWCSENGVGVMAYGSLAYGHADRHIPRRHAIRRERTGDPSAAQWAVSTCSAPCSVRIISVAIYARSRNQGDRREIQQDLAAVRAALDAQPIPRSTPAWSVSAAPRKWRKTWVRWVSRFRRTDMVAIDAIFERNGVGDGTTRLAGGRSRRLNPQQRRKHDAGPTFCSNDERLRDFRL